MTTLFLILVGIGTFAVLSTVYNRANDRENKTPSRRPPHYYQ
jgi:hypothetical protein